MTYFIHNFIKGAASITLFPQERINSDGITQRARIQNKPVGATIKKHFFEIMMGQIINFILIIAMLVLTLYVAYLQMPDLYCVIPVSMAFFFLYAPKIWLYFRE